MGFFIINNMYYNWWNEEDKALLSQGTILVKSDLNELLPINMFYKVVKTNPFNSLLSFIIVSIVIVFLSSVTSYVMTKTPILKRYV